MVKQRTEWGRSEECLAERAHPPNQEINFSHLTCKPRKQCWEVLSGNWSQPGPEWPLHLCSAFHSSPDFQACSLPATQQGVGPIWEERWAGSRWTDATSGWVRSTSVSAAWKLLGLAVQWGSIDNPGKEGESSPACWHEGPDRQMRAASSCLWYRLKQLTSISYFKISLNLHFMCASSQL